MAQPAGRLDRGLDDGYWLHQRRLHDGDPLDILVGTRWIAGHVHYEPSNGLWYCDACFISILLYDGREGQFRLELALQKQGTKKIS